MEEMQEDDDNILSFLESTGYIRIEKGTYATSKSLYIAYRKWCSDNLDTPVSERSFAGDLKIELPIMGWSMTRTFQWITVGFVEDSEEYMSR